MWTSDELATCLELQREECESLEAIYGSEVVSFSFVEDDDRPNSSSKEGSLSSSSFTAQLKIVMGIELAEGGTKVLLRPRNFDPPSTSSGGSSSSAPSAASLLYLSHLPPLTLTIAYPPSYPLHSSPTLLSISTPTSIPYLFPKFLRSTLPKLLEQTHLASSPDPSLWTFLELVRTADFLPTTKTPNKESVIEVPTNEESEDGLRRLGRKLVDWDRGMRGEGFERTTFDCGICLEEKKGRKCLELEGCGHVFCRSCLASCWTLAITEGDVGAVSCPSVDCVKKRTSPAPLPSSEQEVDVVLDEEEASRKGEVFGEVVRDLLGEEQFERWTRLKEKKRVESDPSYTFCPLPSCQAPVPAPPASETTGKDDRWSHYRVCPSCSYSFCLFCRLTWHGVHTPCLLPTLPPFLSTYISLPPDSPTRKMLEKRYGAKNLERMARQALEDLGNKKWFEERSRVCGGCGVRVEKSHGCNHMTCSHCQTHFCFRCSKALPPTQPYKHYQIPGTPCFEQLFDADEVAAFNRGVMNVNVADEGGGGGVGGGGAWGGGEEDGEWEDAAGFGFDRLEIEDFDGRPGRRRWEGV